MDLGADAALGGGPAVICCLGPLWPFLAAAARQPPLPSITHASLVPGATIAAHLPCARVPLLLVGAAELPGVAGALRRLRAAPSIAGAADWQVGKWTSPRAAHPWSSAVVKAPEPALKPAHPAVKAAELL